MKLVNKIAIFSLISRFEGPRGFDEYKDFIKLDEVDEELLEETVKQLYKKEYNSAYFYYKKHRKGFLGLKPLFTEQELDVKSKESASNFINKLTLIRTVKLSD